MSPFRGTGCVLKGESEVQYIKVSNAEIKISEKLKEWFKLTIEGIPLDQSVTGRQCQKMLY